MKYIEKQPEPDQFRQWKEGVSADWIPSWGALDDAPNVKKALKGQLLSEQGAICCYCGMSVNQNNSHIEHIKPRKNYPEEALNYNNLLASCLPDQEKRVKLHCGMHKKDWYVTSEFVSPLDSSCQERFGFGSNGAIMEKNQQDHSATITIQKLGLNCTQLIAHRKKAIEGSGLFDDTLSEDDLERFADAIMRRDDEGHFIEFCFVISSVLKELAGFNFSRTVG
jgi:uncharacterized protein (TIGR02646 family)